jgi:hypothetical protein
MSQECREISKTLELSELAASNSCPSATTAEENHQLTGPCTALGTPAFNNIFRAALMAHRDNGMTMDFAMGPNQGQGVPAFPNNTGLQWDLVSDLIRKSIRSDIRLDDSLALAWNMSRC